MKNSRPDLIIFDCDGVLVDSEPLVNRLYAEMLAEAGHVVDYEQSLHEFAGAAMSTRLEVLSPRLGWAPPADFAAQFMARQEALFARELKPVPGITQILAQLDTPCCVASNGARAEIVFRLETCGLQSFFGDRIFSGVEMPRPKPWPDVYLAAAAAFTAQPARCLVVEDSVTGVTAAVRAGMFVLGHAAHSKAQDLRAAGAALTFTDMQDLPELLARGLSEA